MEQSLVKKRVVGVDISLEATIYAIVDAKGEIIAKRSFPTEDYPDVNEYVMVLSSSILDLVERNGGYESIRSVGISAPSGNFMTGSIENSPNMPWKGVIPVAALLRDRMGLAVALANNAPVWRGMAVSVPVATKVAWSSTRLRRVSFRLHASFW